MQVLPTFTGKLDWPQTVVSNQAKLTFSEVHTES